MPLLIDAHEDLAWNIHTLNRDYTRSALDIRKRESKDNNSKLNGNSLLGWENYQRGKVAVIFATLFVSPLRKKLGGWDTEVYRDFDQAHRTNKKQAETYKALAGDHPDKFRLVRTKGDLAEVIGDWKKPGKDHPVGLVLLMEGAEGVRKPAELEDWWETGVRIIGPAWAGTRFCGGSHEPGPLTEEGRALLKGMAETGFALDISHMDELAAKQALDEFPGPVIASHANCAALIQGYEGNRQLSDDIIRRTIARDGVIGLVPFLAFLKNGWKISDGRKGFSLSDPYCAHIDHVCQLAGDAWHAAIGTDFDGGFGVESVPEDVDSIDDLQKLHPVLQDRGFVEAEIERIMNGNWLRFLEACLPG